MNPDEPTGAIDPTSPSEPTNTANPTNQASNRLVSVLVSVITGSLAGIFLHYILYLMSIPQKPFIYAWF